METVTEESAVTPAKKGKIKAKYPYDFKTLFGFSTMNWATVGGSILYQYFFMIYMTDYAGIDQLVKQAGFAATLATSVLLIARIIDMLDDPLEGWIMDSAKWGWLGKYKKFALLSVILVTFSTIALFSIPHFVKSDKVMVGIWVTLFYIFYEIGVSFASSEMLKQSITNDVALRTKLTTIPRIWSVLILLPFATFFSIVTVVNNKIGDMGKSITLVMAILLGLMAVISVVGVLLIKEGRVESEAEAKRARVSFKDIVDMFKMNKPLLVNLLATIFSGFTYTISTVTLIYFIKYAYCFNPVTGAVDSARFGLLSGINGIMAILMNILGAIFAPLAIKLVGDILKTIKVGFVGMAAISLSIYLLNVFGVLNKSPILFLVMFFLQGFVMGTIFVPQTLIQLECVDYVEYKMHKRMAGVVISAGTFLSKAQTALTTVIVGAILIAIGYSVNATTGNYVGELARIPTMLNWLMVVSGLVPAILVVIALVIYHYFYPITPTKRKEMEDELAERHAAVQGDLA